MCTPCLTRNPEITQLPPTRTKGQSCVCDPTAFRDCPGHRRSGLFGRRMASRPKDAATAERLLRYARPNDSDAEIAERLKAKKPYRLDIAYHWQGHPREELVQYKVAVRLEPTAIAGQSNPHFSPSFPVAITSLASPSRHGHKPSTPIPKGVAAAGF